MDARLFIPIVLGLAAGIFINYASDVLPRTRRFSQPACLHCQTPFSWMDYLALRACRQCGRTRTLRTWLVLIVAAASFAYVWLVPPRSLSLPLSVLVLTYFGIITVIDLEHRLILHPTSIFGAALGVVVGTSIYTRKYELPGAVGISLLGGIIGFGLMFLLYKLGAVIARYRARKLQAAGLEDDHEEALGGGDVYLAGVLGLMLGLPIITALLYGAVLGGLVSLVIVIFIIVRRKYASEALMVFIPYGPYYILGASLILFQP